MQANLNSTNATQQRNERRGPSSSAESIGQVGFKVSWKKDRVYSVVPEAPLWEVAQLMRDHQIGDVVVMERSGAPARLVGMITDRDIALCLSQRVDLMNLKVLDVMSPSVITASISDDLFKLIQTMKEGGVTRLPMMDETGEIVGVLTAKNILEILVTCFADMTHISEQQQKNEKFSQH